MVYLCSLSAPLAATTNTVTIFITPTAANEFLPQEALGAGVDALFDQNPFQVYSPSNVDWMLSAGHGRLTYRLATELGVQDWHWNPNGTWSDSSGGGQGYFTGSTDTNGGMIIHSYGYELPHRGFTSDQQGTDRYSRLTDGRTSTYWKSNPYLTQAFTGEPDSAHPQWAIVDLGSTKSINAIRIAWANPYATSYQVQYWTGTDAIKIPTNGNWRTFPAGSITNGLGGTETLRLSATSVSTRFVRVLMTASSHTYDTHGPGDVRNGVGYAIAEIYVGTLSSTGTFTDLVDHSADINQTTTYVSSVDPWHSPSDQTTDMEQAGLDFIFTNGITRGLPALVPVPMLYSTPENAAAQIQYLKARGHPIAYVEMGEEPDGQSMTPEDYGTLYLQWATALHAVDPTLKLGGPVFAASAAEVRTWPDTSGETSWLKRFVNYLSAHGRLSDLSFMSFEHYPFAPCEDAWTALRREPTIVSNIMAKWRAAGLPADLPIFATEYNISTDFSPAAQQLVGALWQADFVGSFLTAGGAGAYYYQYEPLPLEANEDCGSWGTFGMFTVDANNQVKARTAQYYSTQLICQQWARPDGQPYRVYPAHSDLFNTSKQELVTAYALVTPDGNWSLMLINKDNAAARYIRVQFSNTVTHAVTPWTGMADFHQFTSAQYVWRAANANGYPSPSLPPVVSQIVCAPKSAVLLAAGSLNLLRSTGPVKPLCPPDKTVECSSAWDFDKPASADLLCLNTNVTASALNTVTNGVYPQWITRTWLVTDLCGNTNICSQTVKVVDSLLTTNKSKPTITSPTSNAQLTNGTATVRGSMGGSLAVTQVWYQVNGGSLQPVATTNRFTNWWADVALQPGTNRFFVLSVDLCGNVLSTNSRNFFFVVLSPFHRQTNGLGRVAYQSSSYGASSNGALLQVGRGYTVTATPGNQYLFSNWVSMVDGETNVVDGAPTLTFIMQSNLTLQANFVTNRFLTVTGNYNGLFRDTNQGVTHQSAGFFSLTVSAPSSQPGVYSGKLYSEGSPFSFTGKFDLDGRSVAPQPILRSGKSSLTVNLCLPFDGSDTASGTVSNSDGSWVSDLHGDRAGFRLPGKPATNFVGAYTLAIPGSANASQSPAGFGYGVVSIASNGTVTLTGNLGDGASLSQAVPLSKNGVWPLYSPLYPYIKYTYWHGVRIKNGQGLAGSILGWVTVSNGLTGELCWVKNPVTNDAFYPNGFTNNVELLASTYVPPAATNRAITLTDGSNGIVTLQDGNLTSPLTNRVWLSNLNRFTAQTNYGLTLKLTPKTGLLTGSFKNPDRNNLVTPFSGVLLQEDNIGLGYFKGTNQSGSFRLQGTEP